MGEASVEKIAAGKVLFLQGSDYQHLYLLHGGTVEILTASREFNGLAEPLILSNSFRVALIAEKSFLAPLPGKSIRAVTECQLEKVMLPPGGLGELSASQPAVAMNILVSHFRRMEVSFADMGKYIKMYQALARFIDNLTCVHREFSARELPVPLAERANDIYDSLKATGGFPAVVPSNWMITDSAERFGISYDVPGEPVEELFNKEHYTFLKRFLKINRTVFAHVMKCDPQIPAYIGDTVLKKCGGILDKTAEISHLIEAKMAALFGPQNSLVSVLAEGALRDWQVSGRLAPDFMPQLLNVCSRFYAMYDELTGRKSADRFPGIRQLSQSVNQLQQMAQSRAEVSPRLAPGEELKSSGAAAPARAVAAGPVDSNVMRLYDNSLQQILEFAMLGGEQQKLFLKGLADFKKLPDPMAADDVARKVRRSVARLYWELYGAAFVRSMSVKQVPAPVRLMLRFGFVDETLVEPDQIMSLHANVADAYESSYLPILTEGEFLTKIWNQEEPPSITDMGISWEAYLREQARMSSRKGPDPMADLTDPVKQVQFEIANRIHQTAIVCSGSISTAFPIFTYHLSRGPVDNVIMTKKKIESVMKGLIDTDYSAFFRETVLKLDDAREVIEEEILPYIIILPVFGMKTMMWQEIVGVNKRSRARIVVPSMFVGDIVKSLAHSIAVFRWELLRSTKGGMWADPVEGGLTGAYQDYVQFFKKNNKLSVEAREKIQDRLRSHRNNPRELFAEDYMLWVLFEKNGIMKMNNVSRDLFYRYVPFRKDVREKLERMPAFTESAVRFKNIRKRTADQFERKFRKYIDGQGALPPEIQKYMNYLQL